MGFAVGLLFELMWLTSPPVGGYIPPDGSFGAIAAGATAAMITTRTGLDPRAVAFLCFFVFIPVAHFGSKIDYFLRSRLAGLAVKAEKTLICRKRAVFFPYFASALLQGFVLAAVCLIPIIYIGAYSLTVLVSLFPNQLLQAMIFGFYMIPAFLAFELFRNIYDTRSLVLFISGLSISLLVGVFLTI